MATPNLKLCRHTQEGFVEQLGITGFHFKRLAPRSAYRDFECVVLIETRFRGGFCGNFAPRLRAGGFGPRDPK